MTEHWKREQRRRARRRISDLVAADQADGHVTIQALAEHWDVSEKTIMKWIEAGLLRAYRFPTARRDQQGLWRVRVEDAIAFTERHRIYGR